MSYTITPSQAQFFADNGYLVLRDVFSPTETTVLQQWAQEVHDLPRTSDTPWMPYEEVNAAGERVLCRTENYANYHRDFNALLRGSKLLGILGQLSGEEMLLFKEKSEGLVCHIIFIKVNYKLPLAGGFAPHLDSTAYTHVKNIKHLTVLLAVDDSNMSNGGLEVVSGSHAMDVPIDTSDNCIDSSWVAEQEWIPAELRAGEFLIFGSYLAHRSGPNKSSSSRKAIYATYNCKSEGDLHDAYYEDRAKLWPPTHKRRVGEKYDEGALRYGFGSPMLSVDAGQQMSY